MRVLLTGFAGSGKSTVGRLVAAELGAELVDLDRQIEARAGRSIAQIFAGEGEAAFRAIERAVALETLDRPGALVVALGGGTLLDREVRERALASGLLVALHVAPETAVARVQASDEERPLLGGGEPVAAARELMAARAGVYALAHAGVSTDGRTPAAVAREVVAFVRGEAIPVSLGARSYPVWVGRGLLARVPELLAEAGLGARSIALVCDRNVVHRWGGPLARALARRTRRLVRVVQPPGEARKNLASAARILGQLLRSGWERTDPVVALGGGVVSDLAGFVAATALRGVPFVPLPTTLLAQADASVGGKVGVDHPAGKNLIGAFHQPRLVVADLDTLSTVSRRHVRNGLAEIVKCGVIRDELILTALEAAAGALAEGALEPIEEPLRRSITVKAAIVAADERESGERRALNFGHTIGHAIEAAMKYRGILHGEAVAIGMVAALRIGRERGLTPEPLARRVPDLLARLGLPTELPANLAPRALGAAVVRDKKSAGGVLRMVVAVGGGRTQELPVSADEALAGLERRR